MIGDPIEMFLVSIGTDRRWESMHNSSFHEFHIHILTQEKKVQMRIYSFLRKAYFSHSTSFFLDV